MRRLCRRGIYGSGFAPMEADFTRAGQVDGIMERGQPSRVNGPLTPALSPVERENGSPVVSAGKVSATESCVTRRGNRKTAMVDGRYTNRILNFAHFFGRSSHGPVEKSGVDFASLHGMSRWGWGICLGKAGVLGVNLKRGEGRLTSMV